MRYHLLMTVLLMTVLPGAVPARAADFASDFAQTHDRVWLGAQYWANPMEDWRINDGRLECVRGGGNRNVHLLTRMLDASSGTLHVSVRLGRLDNGGGAGSAGFAIGVWDDVTNDPDASLLHGNGLAAGITGDGRLFIGNPQDATAAIERPVRSVELRLAGGPHEGAYRLVLTAHDAETGERWARVARTGLAAASLRGNVALVNNHAGNRRPRVGGSGPLPRFWFSDWKVSGEKVVVREDAEFGPILYAMHTLSRGVLKMTAQMPPLGAEDTSHVELLARDGDDWRRVDRQPIHPLARTATFRIADWDDRRDVAYRLVYRQKRRGGETETHAFDGTVRKDPVAKDEIVIAGFTGNTDSGFPNRRIARNVGILNPDVLFFSGDQIYESVGGYGIHREPLELATLNYLRKIYLWGFAFRDLMRDRATLLCPDDHDVYQGNIWGENGRDCGGIRNHAQGGYAMNATWVNAVQRTQTAHHPDPFDPRPVEQQIGVYFGDMVYGRISFAILEDRKFKSGPEGKVNTWEGRPDHVKDPDLDPQTVDKPGLELLGDRQLRFLRHWSGDWKGADMKIALSQTIFCNLANYHGARQEYLVADLDSNGWPQSGRNRALAELRRGTAFHFAGDQHLPSIVHHGIDAWRDAGFSFCVPSIAAGYPRSWRPDEEGRPVRNRPEAGLPNTGDYVDGLGNHVTVHAIGNPAGENRPGRMKTLHDKASGFGIVRLHKPQGTITMECYRLLIDAENLKPEDQFPGWPKTIHYTENDGRRAAAYLPELHVAGLQHPVVQVVDEQSRDLLYTLRIRGTSFRPKVFDAEHTYTVRVGDGDPETFKALSGVRPVDKNAKVQLRVAF